jgi:hypothetical protein
LTQTILPRTDVADRSGLADAHKFAVGATVLFNPGFPNRNIAAGDYSIVRQLPPMHGEYQYRIKSAREPHERMVKESEIHGGRSPFREH